MGRGRPGGWGAVGRGGVRWRAGRGQRAEVRARSRRGGASLHVRCESRGATCRTEGERRANDAQAWADLAWTSGDPNCTSRVHGKILGSFLVGSEPPNLG